MKVMRDMVSNDCNTRYLQLYSDAEHLLRESNKCVDYIKKVMF